MIGFLALSFLRISSIELDVSMKYILFIAYITIRTSIAFFLAHSCSFYIIIKLEKFLRSIIFNI